MKIYFLFLFFCILVYADEQKVEITFSDGSSIKCLLVEETADYYQVRLNSKIFQVIKKDVVKLNPIMDSEVEKCQLFLKQVEEALPVLKKKTESLLKEGKYEAAEESLRELRVCQEKREKMRQHLRNITQHSEKKEFFQERKVEAFSPGREEMLRQIEQVQKEAHQNAILLKEQIHHVMQQQEEGAKEYLKSIRKQFEEARVDLEQQKVKYAQENQNETIKYLDELMNTQKEQLRHYEEEVKEQLNKEHKKLEHELKKHLEEIEQQAREKIEHVERQFGEENKEKESSFENKIEKLERAVGKLKKEIARLEERTKKELEQGNPDKAHDFHQKMQQLKAELQEHYAMLEATRTEKQRNRHSHESERAELKERLLQLQKEMESLKNHGHHDEAKKIYLEIKKIEQHLEKK